MYVSGEKTLSSLNFLDFWTLTSFEVLYRVHWYTTVNSKCVNSQRVRIIQQELLIWRSPIYHLHSFNTLEWICNLYKYLLMNLSRNMFIQDDFYINFHLFIFFFIYFNLQGHVPQSQKHWTTIWVVSVIKFSVVLLLLLLSVSKLLLNF